MNPFKKFMYKYVCGGFTFKVKDIIFKFPKTSLYIIPSFIFLLLSEYLDFFKFIGGVLFLIGLISYAYPLINPLKIEEMNELNKDD